MSLGVQPPPRPREICFLIIPVLGDIISVAVPAWRSDRTYGWLKENISPHFDEGFEHVAVLYRGERRDMFVGETSSINGRHIRNVRATEIYRAATLSRDAALTSRRDPESLDAISGPAVLFPDEIVWK